ncbi:hypothetical protein ACFFWD_39080 [Bradyrhizobium erythrophlei]|uniref:hypothetical protein n=1 Tax=Bradyrhizobium erythrophlei TaxID=1437360 RepID=UPI0035EE4981
MRGDATGVARVRARQMRIGTASFRNVGTSLALPLIAIGGIAAWLMLPEPSDAEGQAASPASSAIVLTAQTTSTDAPPSPAADKDTAAPSAIAAPADEPATVGIATAPDAQPEKLPLDGLRISSQSFRRGGLGSKALVTLTLRNGNDFAVKDIEIACAFTRSDGTQLTERKRLIPDTIAMKSRKTYPGILIGFVNINANKAKCSVVTASRI